MRKKLAIFFIYLATFNLLLMSAGIHENSINNSIHHYNIHQEEGGISMASFLLIHYCPFSKHASLPMGELPLLLKHIGIYFYKTDSFVFAALSKNTIIEFPVLIENYLYLYKAEFFNPPE